MTARFFDSAAYLLFSTATNEKPVVAARIGAELGRIAPGSKALQCWTPAWAMPPC